MVEKQERQESQAISHKRKYVPPIKANHLSVTIEVSNCDMVLTNFQGHNGYQFTFCDKMQKQYLDLKRRNDSFKSFKEERTPNGQVPGYQNMNTRNNQTGERGSHSGPFMSKRNMAKSTIHVKENVPAPRYPPSRVNPKILTSSLSSKALLDQPVMDQRKIDRRVYNRADTMDSRRMTTPVDLAWVR